MVIIFFCLLIIIILLLLPVLVFKRTSRELNGNLSWGSVKNKPLIYQSEVNEDTLLDTFFRMALVLFFYIISSLGIFGSLITINLLIESHYSLIAIFISLGWLSHFVLCFAWILNYRVHRFIPIIYLFTSISCAIVPALLHKSNLS
jgi:hypothetical protein